MPEFIEVISLTGFEILPLKNEHLIVYENFEFPAQNRDPFDRLLISVATYEEATVISKDDKFKFYHSDINVIW
ncbi:MAG: hypothetical protein JWN56_17 [Sphingobacteriales bacterium]|nr:hypothetical protein [Sphingobacteriales bacterium]